MLRQLLAADHEPLLIVEEDSPVGDEERRKFLRRIAGHPLAPPLAEQAQRRGIPIVRVPIHDDAHVLPALAERELDLIVLGGTRIVRGKLLERARHGVINSHPGLLPECRGSASPAWSVFHDIPIGASTHFCDPGIDTGDLLLRRQVAVKRGMTYEDLCYTTLVLAGTLMQEALTAYRQGRWSELRRPQGVSPWPTFKNAPDDVLDAVRRKLAAGTYAHYVEGTAGGDPSGGSAPARGSAGTSTA
jgi:methionyl-tRNA formyltransferase